MDGVVVVDKPAGPTSHDVVDRVRRAAGTRRVGHTGTLDPFATGVLPVCVGRATRLARFLGGGEKEYLAAVRLGFATATDDAMGERVGEERPFDVPEAALLEAVASLVGDYDQVPPAFSARHVNGLRSYELARRGESVPLAATRVRVSAIDVRGREADLVDLAVRCSAGTYVRAIARDLGRRLGTGGHLAALRRTRSGEFDLSRAVPGDALTPESLAEAIVRMGQLLPGLPAVVVTEEGRRRVGHGREVGADAVRSGLPEAAVERVRLLDESGDLVALAVPRGTGGAVAGLPRPWVLQPDVVLLGG